LLLASCATPANGLVATPAGGRHVWTNAQTRGAIIIDGGTAVVDGHSYPLRSCSTADRLCVESDGPINLTVNQSCDNLPNGETRIWSMVHHSPILRDNRSPQVLYEYSYEEGVTAIYYAPEGLGITEHAGPNLLDLDRYKYEVSGGRRFMACR
jgi:hypothetical protein